MALADTLKEQLGTLEAWKVKSQGFHWNVEGDNFVQLHDLFGKIYEDAQDAIDHIAEHIRAIEGLAPFALKRIQELGRIKDSSEAPKDLKMVQELLADTQIVMDHLEECHDIATEYKKYGLINFLEGRMDIHAKYMWMLRSTLE